MFVENVVYVFKQIIGDALQTGYFIHTMLVCRILIGGVMVDMLVSQVVDRGFEPRYGQTKDYKIVIYCFSAKHTALRNRSNDWLARNQDNMSEWGDLSIRGLLSLRYKQSN